MKKRDCFEDVPVALMDMFGVPQLVMVFPIAKRESLGMADIHRVRTEMEANGYYLQIPPPQVNLLAEHKRSLGIKD
ncbi:protein YcgL [Shewanella sp. HN-41]|nr:protein YcgL [Shewanella sp. HN-41]